MSGPPVRFVGLAGSLRRHSTNAALLRAAAASAPEGIGLVLYDGLAGLPPFNPDHDVDPPAVAAWRAVVRHADGLVLAVPEYAHGIPGAFKNALDWLVSGSEIPHKPVALFHASPRSHHGRAALEEVLRTMSVRIVPEAALEVPLLGLTPAAAADRLAHPATASALRVALSRLAEAVAAAPAA